MRVLLALPLLLCLGCRPEATQVVVAVSGVPADTERLAVTAQLDAQRTTLLVSPPWIFSLSLPAERTGDLRLDVRALQKDECSQFGVQRTVPLSGSPAERVDLVLAAEAQALCALRVERDGDGTGEITSQPPGISCGDTCVGLFPRGSRVRLSVRPAADSYLSSWQQPTCPPTASVCEVALAAGTRVRPGLARKICTPDGFCWELPLPQGNRLASVFALTPDNVYAVGPVGTVLRHDGKTWRPAPRTWLRPGEAPPALNAVWASGPADVWAAGDGVVLHSTDGQTFTRQDLPGRWLGLAGSGPADLWLVGEDGVRHNGGGGFVPYSAGLPALRGTLHAVWAGNGDEVWVVGEKGQVLHRPSGQSWRAEVLPEGSKAMDCLTVGGRGPGEAWVGGDDHEADPMQGKARLVRFTGGGAGRGVLDAQIDGVLALRDQVVAVGPGVWVGDGMGSWDRPQIPEIPNYLAAVHGTDAEHLWLVGPEGIILSKAQGAWVSRHQRPDVASLLAVAADEVFSTGPDFTRRFDGATWSEVAFERGAEGWGLSLWGQGDRVWLAGGRSVDGKFLPAVWSLERGGTQEAPLRTFRPVSPAIPAGLGDTFELRALWGTGPSDLWAVGRDLPNPGKGLILHLSGGTWRATSTDPDGKPLPVLQTVFGAGGSVWVAGSRRVILRSDNGGGTWIREDIRPADLPSDPMKRDTVVWNGLWGLGPTAMWAVANLECDCEAYVLRRNTDASWSVADRSTEIELNGIAGTGERDIWVAGGAWNHGVLKHYEGQGWPELEQAMDGAFRGVWLGPAGTWVGSSQGLLRRVR